MLGCVVRSSSGLFDGVRMKLNELAIALSEELTLEAEEQRGSNLVRITLFKDGRTDILIHHQCQIHRACFLQHYEVKKESHESCPLVTLGYLPSQSPTARTAVVSLTWMRPSLCHIEVVRCARRRSKGRHVANWKHGPSVAERVRRFYQMP
jgi:hypothetical protein